MLYHEDDDLFFRITESGGSLYYVHNAIVEHIGGASSSRSPEIAALKAWHMAKSKIYVSKKHNRSFGKIRTILHGFLLILSPECLFSRRKRAKHFAFLLGALGQNINHEGLDN